MELFPAMPLREWHDTKETLHRFAQIVGKLRMAASPQRNHWWHVPFHLTGRGITTRPMGDAGGGTAFSVDFDFVDHRLHIQELSGPRLSFPLHGQSVASFYHELTHALAALGVEARIEHPYPFDLPDSGRPFAEDTEHATYDPAWATRYWWVLTQVGLVLEEFAAGYSGKVSPVHHFWHTFDIAHTRFADRKVDHSAEVNRVVREAYSREVISFGFWFGDEHTPDPAFYAYLAPEPAGLADRGLRPEAAVWTPSDGRHLGLLRYDDARAAEDPRAAVLEFYETAYRSAAELAGWDIGYYACPGGVTDPVRAAERQ